MLIVIELVTDFMWQRNNAEITAYLINKSRRWPTPAAARSKVWVFGRSLAGIVGSNPYGRYAHPSLESVGCCQIEFLRPADPSPIGFLPSVYVCVCVCVCVPDCG
jgi:hypothetical protein